MSFGLEQELHLRSVNFKRTIWYPQFFKTNEQKKSPYDTLGRSTFYGFILIGKNLKKPKRHF